MGLIANFTAFILGSLSGVGLALVTVVVFMAFRQGALPPLSVVFYPNFVLRTYYARFLMWGITASWSLSSVKEIGFLKFDFDAFPTELYTYKRLDPNRRTIRLLRVTRGGATVHQDKFHANFVEVCLDQPEFNYLALSYTWGTGSDAAKKNLLRVGEHQYLYISSQVLAILQAVLKPGRTMHLWIDALCINQADIGEKNQQVPYMRDIYQKSSHVIISLGKSTKKTDQVMDAIYPLYAYQKSEKSQKVYSPAGSALPLLGDFLRHPYFSRIWVIQEVASADKVTIICGNRAVQYDHLVDLLWKLTLFGHESFLRGYDPVAPGHAFFLRAPEGYQNSILMSEMRYNLQSKAPGLSFSEILVRLSHFHSTDPRDKIYGLLGFVKEKGEIPSEPDYDDSNQPEELYKKTASFLLQRDPSLSILHRAGTGYWRPTKLEYLPSWVPDWRLVDKDVKVFGFQKQSQFCAGGVAVRPARYQAPNILAVDGMVVDMVAKLSRTRPAPPSCHGSGVFGRGKTDELQIAEFRRDSGLWFQDVEAFIESMTRPGVCRSWKESEEKVYPPGKPSESLRGALTNTVLAGEVTLGASLGEDVYMKTLNRIVEIYTDPKSEELIEGSTFNYNAGITAATNQRRFFTTSSGLIGLTSPGTMEGDVVCLLRGATTPFILRQGLSSEEGVKFWELVSEAYVHGLMHGEGLREKKVEELLLV
jgi:hypothetical protein